MNKLLMLILVCLSMNFLSGQTDEDLIRHTLHNYFHGTSYSYSDLIKSAFHPQTPFFLENGDGEPMILSVDEYVDLYSKREPGKFIGRYNKIISIEQTGNLAQAKAEITIPSIQRIYTDMFILRRMEDGKWLIIGKAANSRSIE